MEQQTDGTNIITTGSAEAAAFYTNGVIMLIRASADARQQLLDAISTDAHLAVALAAFAVDARTRGFENECDQVIERAMTATHGITRRERQHVEIVALVLAGDIDRARALGAAHLKEFRDPLIDHLFAPSRPT
jgi:DNA-binding GntR family transcriptional regulator